MLSSSRIFFADYSFDIWPNVYKPAEDSFFFAKQLNSVRNSQVLDMGTGCGILGIVAASQDNHVVAVDINPYAVRCAKRNARLNQVENSMCFLQGDLFKPLRLEEKFDVVLFNAPYLPEKPADAWDWLDKAWNGGLSGRHVINRFVLGVPSHLKTEGKAFLLISSITGIDEILRKFKQNSLAAKIVAEQPLPLFETLVLIEAKHYHGLP